VPARADQVMSFANAMDDLIPSKLGAEEDATTVKRDWAVISAHFVSLFLWVLFAVHDIHRHKGGNDVDHARLGAASGKLGVTRYARIPGWRSRAHVWTAFANAAIEYRRVRAIVSLLPVTREKATPRGCYHCRFTSAVDVSSILRRP